MYLICVTIISSKTPKKKWHCSISQKWYRNWRFSRTLWARVVYTPLLNPSPSFWKFTLSSKVSSACSTPNLLAKLTITGCHDISKKVWGLIYCWEETLESVEGDSYGEWQNSSEVIFANILTHEEGYSLLQSPTKRNPDTCMSCYSEINPETFYFYLATLIVKIYKVVQNCAGNKGYTRINYFLCSLLFLSLNFWQSGQYHFLLSIFDRCRHLHETIQYCK